MQRCALWPSVHLRCEKFQFFLHYRRNGWEWFWNVSAGPSCQRQRVGGPLTRVLDGRGQFQRRRRAPADGADLVDPSVAEPPDGGDGAAGRNVASGAAFRQRSRPPGPAGARRRNGAGTPRRFVEPGRGADGPAAAAAGRPARSAAQGRRGGRHPHRMPPHVVRSGARGRPASPVPAARGRRQALTSQVKKRK